VRFEQQKNLKMQNVSKTWDGADSKCVMR